MPLTRLDFVTLVTSRVPESDATVSAHLQDSGELLLHLLVADLRRLAIQWFDRGRYEPLGRLLNVIETGFEKATRTSRMRSRFPSSKTRAGGTSRCNRSSPFGLRLSRVS